MRNKETNIMAKTIAAYFDLGLFPFKPEFGQEEQAKERRRKRKKLFWTIVLYLGVCLGVLASFLMNPLNGQELDLRAFDFSRLISAFITSMLIYPTIYKLAKFDVEAPNIIQFFTAFQNGFFWEVMLNVVIKNIQGNSPIQ